jgi:predicted membrane protein
MYGVNGCLCSLLLIFSRLNEDLRHVYFLVRFLFACTSILLWFLTFVSVPLTMYYIYINCALVLYQLSTPYQKKKEKKVSFFVVHQPDSKSSIATRSKALTQRAL